MNFSKVLILVGLLILPQEGRARQLAPVDGFGSSAAGVSMPAADSPSVIAKQTPDEKKVAKPPGLVDSAYTKVTSLIRNYWSGGWGGGAKDPVPLNNVSASAKQAPASDAAVSGVPVQPSKGTAGFDNPALPVATSPWAAAPRKVEKNIAENPVRGSVLTSIDTTKVGLLELPQEARIRASDYLLDGKHKSLFEKKVITPIFTPSMVSKKEMDRWTGYKSPAISKVPFDQFPVLTADLSKIRNYADTYQVSQKAETPIELKKFFPLSADEYKFLSALYIMKQEKKCTAAAPLLHSLSEKKDWQAEADFHLAQCSKQLNMLSEFHERARRVIDAKDTDYTPLAIKLLEADVPYEYTDLIGNALTKYMQDKPAPLDPKTLQNASYLIAEYAAAMEKHKTALEWAAKVPQSHPNYPEAQFIFALAQNNNNQQSEAIKTLKSVLAFMLEKKMRPEFQALVSLNLGRLLFQEKKFTEAREKLLMVTKDHPLWLQSLTEMGWAQLMSDDHEGAVGNMYSVHSPFFAAVYKPESHVIRTIGYLNLCQYGDAYRTLSILERDYRPALEKMEKYHSSTASRSSYYETVRRFLTHPRTNGEGRPTDQWRTDIDGLPMPVVREMARHRDFLNLQNGLNRQIDERALYEQIPSHLAKSAGEWDARVNRTRSKISQLQRTIAGIKTKSQPIAAERKAELQQTLKQTMQQLEDDLFTRDLYQLAQNAMPEYKKTVIGGADRRRSKLRADLERILANRLVRMKTELARMLDNNELLRYEVFAGSGENIRFQVAGGEKVKRVPASIMPQQKSLQWNFDGEYWEDEIGHYRSSLKSNCPDAKVRERASVDVNR